MAGMDHAGGTSMGGMDHSSMTMSPMDLNDVEYDAYLANDRTLDDPLVVRTERQGKVRVRLINGASSTAFWIDLGKTVATLVAVDGNDVLPVSGSRFPIAQAQRLDFIVDVPAGAVIPVFAQREGDSVRTGIVLAASGASVPKFADRAETLAQPVDWSLEERLVAASPLPSRPVDTRQSVMLTGSMSPYVWTIDDRTWSNRRAVVVAKGQRVELEFMNHTTMAHPMHLHGHHFQVTSLNGKPVRGAMRDTVLVPSMASVTVAFDADNPGRWLFHCHNLYHMAAGMMSELVYEA
jgi:FtsP/CotA-like multicopper oxidase with cupredoxin domain